MLRFVSALAPLLVAGALAAQQQPAPLPPPPAILSIPQALASLTDQPPTHTAFTFDHGMLQNAENLIDSGGTARQAVASLASITIDSYHYPRPAFYNPEAMGAIIATYNAAGWKHLVNANANAAQSAQPTSNITDLWLHFSGTDIDNFAVLTRGPRMMNLIQVAGDLRPIDLLHLAGHFGIPKVDPSAVMVPAEPGH